jgi:PTS system mannose-specific IIA component
MTVGVLIVSHNKIGQELVNTAHQMLASSPLPTKVVSIGIDDNLDSIRAQFDQRLIELDQGNGILVLTDMFGSTPSNIACTVSSQDNVKIISGLNLPMLIRVLNYPNLSLEQLEQKALSGGEEGIARCHQSGCTR